MRGRNRKGPNPLSRSFESNGPDVKVRGTAAHIAEKYVQLARDAHTSGDPVAAESYLQHAEHYYRLLMAAQQAQQPPFQQHASGGFQPRQDIVDTDDSEEFDDEFDSGVMDRFTFRSPQQPQPQGGQQAGQPYYGDRQQQGESEGGEGGDQQPRYEPRGDQPREHRYDNRGPRQDRNSGDRQGYDRNNQERGDNRQRFRDRDRDRERQPFGDQRDQRERGPRPAPQPAVEPDVSAPGLPAFITGGRAPAPAEPAAVETSADIRTEAGQEEGFAPRPRRRRRTKAEMEAGYQAANEDKDVTPAAE